MIKLIRSIFIVIGAAITLVSWPQYAMSQNDITPQIVTPEIERLLDRLDSLLVKTPGFVREKEERIRRTREIYARATDLERRYWMASELYDEYCAYDSDSAIYYINKAQEYARRLNRQDLVDEMELNKSYVFSATGLLDEANNCIERLDPNKLPPALAVKYCDRVLFLSTHRDQYMGVKRDTEVYSLMVDSLLQEMTKYIRPEDPQYCWLMGWSNLNQKDKAKAAIPKVARIVDATDYTTRGNAMDAWVLSKMYDRVGDQTNHLKYLILSAMADVRASNKEIASLEELASMLYTMGDLDRANSYINHSIAYANSYKSRVRLGQLAMLQEKILTAIHERSEKEARQNRIYLIALCIFIGILILASVFMLRQNRLLRKSRKAINDANKALGVKVAELQETREELKEANAKLSEMYEKARENARQLSEVNESKEQYIANIFGICSNYINKIDEFRANLHHLLAERKFEQVLRIVKSPELSYEEIKELYSNFDEIFLKIYPDFVADFNTLLRPEERIELKNPGKLTTELRIFALVRLGLNDSIKIAKFLHCSVQTVYNTRQRTRNKAVGPREDFAEAVRALGKPEI